MNELELDANQVLLWFPHEKETPYVLVHVSAEHSKSWPAVLQEAVRRCYLTDEHLQTRAKNLEGKIPGTSECRQIAVINSKLPDPGATMAGDFGEILIYAYQAAKALPAIAFGPKKWRLKQDRTKPAPKSDVLHFILPTWPTASNQDEILCAEVKLKSTKNGKSPISEAIEGCAKDRTSRLSSTLQWLKERAINEPLGQVEIAHLDRFINATDYPPATKRFRAVAIVSSEFLDAELENAPAQASREYSLVVIAVPNLHTIYNEVYKATKSAALKPIPL